jgi:LmbE family N-acetylglucosaminyl deacetylase
MSKVIIITPHPDDETLGCGGTILKHKEDGDSVHWIIVTSMLGESDFSQQLVQQRQGEIERVSGMYGFETTHNLDFPTTRLDEIPARDIIASLSKIFNDTKLSKNATSFHETTKGFYGAEFNYAYNIDGSNNDYGV